MKTIKVTIPGTDNTYQLRKTGEPCEIHPLPEDEYIQTVDGELDTLAVTSGREVYCRPKDIVKVPGTPETTREFRVPKVSMEPDLCPLLCSDCKHIPCIDCIYHYLATL